MIKIQEAKQKDITIIQKIEKEYYEGYACPKNVLKNWIKESSKNFLKYEREDKLIAFLFLEVVNQIKGLPFVHKVQKKSGKYLYVAEIAILDKYAKTNTLNQLFKELLKRNKRKKGIIWVTGGESKHDKTELKVIRKIGFKKLKKISKWEAFPGHFINDHWLWFKKLK